MQLRRYRKLSSYYGCVIPLRHNLTVGGEILQ